MSINMIPVQIPCEFCGELHEEYAIDGHICVPHLCSDCWRKVIEKWNQTPKCIECQHCTYIHEYESYWCSKRKWPVDKDWHTCGCEYFNKYEEVDK